MREGGGGGGLAEGVVVRLAYSMGSYYLGRFYLEVI